MVPSSLAEARNALTAAGQLKKNINRLKKKQAKEQEA